MRTLRDLHFGKTFSKKVKAERLPKVGSGVSFLIVVVLLTTLANFLFSGRATANYIFSNLKPLSYFKDGKFLILFQNNNELRASGGFIGSYAVLEMADLEVKNLTFNTNIYKIDQGYTAKNFVSAPTPIAEFNKGKSWALRDANYDISFPEAAEDINKFYQAETGDSVDGIIAINASLIVDLLKLTGPINLTKYNKTVTADNFIQLTQEEVEKNYFSNPQNWLENEPKTILKDLYGEIIRKALTKDKNTLLEFVQAELAKKEIILYFKDRAKEQAIIEKNFGNKVFDDKQLTVFFGKTPNYLNINVNNFIGNKSSLSVAQTVELETDQNTAALTISRIHHGSTTWPDGANVSYLRLLVPQDSELISANLDGRDVKDLVITGSEAGKTSFATWVRLGPGSSSILKISYRLPEEVDSRLLALQRQPGTVPDEVKIIDENRLLYSGKLDKDIIIGGKSASDL